MSAILPSASDIFLRSDVTTASGALATKRSLLNFFVTPTKKPWVYFSSSSSLTISSSTLTNASAGMV